MSFKNVSKNVLYSVEPEEKQKEIENRLNWSEVLHNKYDFGNNSLLDSTLGAVYMRSGRRWLSRRDVFRDTAFINNYTKIHFAFICFFKIFAP